jgi:hypothetical protein
VLVLAAFVAGALLGWLGARSGIAAR